MITPLYKQMGTYSESIEWAMDILKNADMWDAEFVGIAQSIINMAKELARTKAENERLKQGTDANETN